MKDRWWYFRVSVLLDWGDWVLGVEIAYGLKCFRFAIGPLSIAITPSED